MKGKFKSALTDNIVRFGQRINETLPAHPELAVDLVGVGAIIDGHDMIHVKLVCFHGGGAETLAHRVFILRNHCVDFGFVPTERG